MQVRVRYAPSPTGNQHVGGVRTALFNYLFAKANGGTFILRLEDTDRTRSSDEYVRNLYDTFSWLGFYWDEGPDVGGPYAPYIQSERFALYREHAEKLVAMDRAYYCFCDEERLSRLRAEQTESKSGEQGYDRKCRSLGAEEVAAKLARGAPKVVRLKIPREGTTVFDDMLLGRIEWKNEDVSPDPVLLKSDGFPTYHLANVVDDHFMEITHVMRAQEWIPSAPMHRIMYDAFGWEMPILCHLPMVLGQDGHKLSKRHGATSIDEFRRTGHLPGALINYVAHLGCSYEDGRDLFTLQELGERFSISRLNKAPAVFDYQKLEWFNGQYIRATPDAELASMVVPFLREAGFHVTESSGAPCRLLTDAMPIVRERLHFLSDAPSVMGYLFSSPPVAPAAEFVPRKMDVAGAVRMLEADAAILASCDLSTHEGFEASFRTEAGARGVKLGDLFMPLRVALTGSRVSPPLYESIALLGREETRARIDRALAALALAAAGVPEPEA